MFGSNHCKDDTTSLETRSFFFQEQEMTTSDYNCSAARLIEQPLQGD